jgi:uncharacterized DUF497 family protein
LFEWDEEKNIKNFAKHSIWFEEAQTVWVDPYGVEFLDDENPHAEERYIRIGHSIKNRNLLVVFCERVEGKIRIISARKLTKNERVQYEEGI